MRRDGNLRICTFLHIRPGSTSQLMQRKNGYNQVVRVPPFPLASESTSTVVRTVLGGEQRYGEVLAATQKEIL